MWRRGAQSRCRCGIGNACFLSRCSFQVLGASLGLNANIQKTAIGFTGFATSATSIAYCASFALTILRVQRTALELINRSRCAQYQAMLQRLAHIAAAACIHACLPQPRLCVAACAYAAQVGAQGAQATATGHPCRLVLQAELRPGRVRSIYLAKAAAQHGICAIRTIGHIRPRIVRKPNRQHRLRPPAPAVVPCR